MKIEKFKKMSKGKYKIYFDTLDECILFEDVILKHNLLVNNEIDIKKYDEILNDNKYSEAYYEALNYIERRMKTELEIKNMLIKREYPFEIIDKTIEKLKQLNYINNKTYIHAYVTDKVNLNNAGPYKIKTELLSKGFDEKEIMEEIKKIDNSVWEDKIIKFIERKVRLNKKLSNVMLKNKIKNDLLNLGYEINIIDSLLIIEEPEDIELAKKEYQKALDKYSKKYTGKQLDYKVRNEMYKKGFYNINYGELVDE